MRNILRIILHIAIFAGAFFVFFFGLGIGLAFNPTLGSALWILAGLMAVGNCLWIVRRSSRQRATTKSHD